MKIINIFGKKEYNICLCFFLLNIVSIKLFQDYVEEKLLSFTYFLNLGVAMLFYFFCFFIESEFESEYLRVLQIRFENWLSFASIITTISISILSFLYFIFPLSYYRNIKIIVTDKLHNNRGCDLYNINNTKYFPYQYICPYSSITDIYPDIILNNNKSFLEAKCSKIFPLMNKNEIIESLRKKNNKENIYFCDLKYQYEPIILKNNNNYYFINLYPYLLMIFHIYLVIKFLSLVNTYFKYIKANVNNIIIIDF